MQISRWFARVSRSRCIPVASMAVLMLSVAVLPVAADVSGGANDEATTLSHEVPLSDTLACEGPFALALGDPIPGDPFVCKHCDQEYCGCIPLPECVLVYSCTCSPIQCTRSCKHEDCVY